MSNVQPHAILFLFSRSPLDLMANLLQMSLVQATRVFHFHWSINVVCHQTVLLKWKAIKRFQYNKVCNYHCKKNGILQEQIVCSYKQNSECKTCSKLCQISYFTQAKKSLTHFNKGNNNRINILIRLYCVITSCLIYQQLHAC